MRSNFFPVVALALGLLAGCEAERYSVPVTTRRLEMVAEEPRAVEVANPVSSAPARATTLRPVEAESFKVKPQPPAAVASPAKAPEAAPSPAAPSSASSAPANPCLSNPSPANPEAEFFN